MTRVWFSFRRVDVEEGVGGIRLIHLPRWGLSGNDLAEDAVLTHDVTPSSIRNARTRRGSALIRILTPFGPASYSPTALNPSRSYRRRAGLRLSTVSVTGRPATRASSRMSRRPLGGVVPAPQELDVTAHVRLVQLEDELEVLGRRRPQTVRRLGAAHISPPTRASSANASTRLLLGILA